MTIADRAVFVNGANSGIGQALVQGALRRGAERVCTGRHPAFSHMGSRVRRPIFGGVEKEQEDIFPDPMSESLAESWRGGAVKALEREFAALVEAEPVKS